ncbi:hypothetical protein SDC9_181295 [bioreactor metagenome]|uniref:Uncharacterized protein n=1 Tax=bioreactor metagenome TaxID=1076179 RepID=A0A645HDE5_9ZZZZ
MAVEPTPADHVPARRIERRRAITRNQRRRKQNRGAGFGAQFARDFGGIDARGVDDGGLTVEIRLAAQRPDDLHHGADIENVGHVADGDRPLGQQTGRQHRQRGVFIAPDMNRTLRHHTAANMKLSHESPCSPSKNGVKIDGDPVLRAVAENQRPVACAASRSRR